MSYHKLSPKLKSFSAKLGEESISKNIHEALAHKQWRQAMNEKLEALQKNQTWKIVDLPKGKRAVGCKWVFTVKYKAIGSIERFKARLVAKGFTQTQGIDYFETFAPVAKINTIRILLSLAVNRDWQLYQYDVKNAFLHGDLEEEVYMEIPHGLNIAGSKNKVCWLKNALYGPKQSPKAWFGRFARFTLHIGFHQSQGDHTLFSKHNKERKMVILIIYVDDIMVI